MAAGHADRPVIRRLTKRAQYLRAARGVRASRRSMVLQAVQTDEDMPGIGLTVTKKMGNAPERNRIKRRLRAAVQACAEGFRPRHDYVLIGRRAALDEPFAGLVSQLEALLVRIHDNRHSARQI